MSKILFALIAPTTLPRKGEKRPYSLFTSLKLDETGVLSYRTYTLYQLKEWHPEASPRHLSLPASTFEGLAKAIREAKALLAPFAQAHPEPLEAKKSAHTLVKFPEFDLLVPDYVFDASDKTYLERYESYPDPTLKEAYQCLRNIATLLNQAVKDEKPRPYWEAR